MDTIECHHCHRHCVPRLWHYSPFMGQFRYACTQHICPFCGNTMYETGGQFTTFGLFVLLFFAVVVLGILLLIYFPHFNSGFLLISLLQLGFWGAIVYGDTFKGFDDTEADQFGNL